MANITSGSNFNAKPRFSVAIKSEAYQKIINDTLGDKKVAQTFVADLSACVATNPVLATCTTGSILGAGLQAQRLNLPLTAGLGFVYLVPYGDKAQFQVGYKGLIQLAQRSGQFEKLGVKEVHEGELKGYDEFGDEQVAFSHDYDKNKIIGYFAYFKLLNGFKKTLYWTVDQCKAHAEKYSKSYKSTSATNVWRDQFDLMACKTVLKNLLSKYAPLSVELQQAVLADQAVISENGSYSYVDNETIEEIPAEKVADTEKVENTENTFEI